MIYTYYVGLALKQWSAVTGYGMNQMSFAGSGILFNFYMPAHSWLPIQGMLLTVSLVAFLNFSKSEGVKEKDGDGCE